MSAPARALAALGAVACAAAVGLGAYASHGLADAKALALQTFIGGLDIPAAERERLLERRSRPGLDASLKQAAGAFASRLATRLAFWVSGVAASAWAPMVPFVKQRLQLDDQSLGLLLLCLGLGSVAAMVRTGPLCARYGCKPIVLLGGLCMALMLPVLAVADSMLWMGAALLVFGGALGSLDVAMNIHAVEVERGAGQPMMSGFHAFFIVGGFSGAALVTALLSQTFTLLSAALCDLESFFVSKLQVSLLP